MLKRGSDGEHSAHAVWPYCCPDDIQYQAQDMTTKWGWRCKILSLIKGHPGKFWQQIGRGWQRTGKRLHVYSFYDTVLHFLSTDSAMTFPFTGRPLKRALHHLLSTKRANLGPHKYKLCTGRAPFTTFFSFTGWTYDVSSTIEVFKKAGMMPGRATECTQRHIV